MDVQQVLLNTLSRDAATRTGAEEQLRQAEDANFSVYLATLVQELANEATEPEVRAAAGINLKNSFTARDYNRLREVQEKWLSKTEPETKQRVKELALQTLATANPRAGQAAAQVVSSIAAIELPRHQWPELMQTLVRSVGEGTPVIKQWSLLAIGYICETEDPDLRESLSAYSNAILTAVVQGARKEETNDDVRVSALTALADSLEFVRNNFANEGERNYIMQVVCEATQATDSRIQQGAFGCLNRIMSLYYSDMRFYMEKALFGLTIMGMKSEEEDVAKLAIEFWCTVCEEEMQIEDENAQAQYDRPTEMRPYFNFAKIAAGEVVPVLLQLLARQDEDAPDDEYDISRAAYQCLQLYSNAIGGQIIPTVLQFVEANLRAEDWHLRDAAVSAFGAIMEGPDEKVLEPIVKQALPVLIEMMQDKMVMVQDSAAYALGRICEACPEAIDPATHLAALVSALFEGLASSPKMAASCCWALMNLAERFSGEIGCQQNPLTPHFNESVSRLLQATERTDGDNQLRTAAYEVLCSFVNNSANESMPALASLLDVITKRVEDTVPMQSQVVSIEDRLMLEEMQSSLCSVLMSLIQRVDKEIAPQSDRIMHILLQLLNTAGPKSVVPDSVFAAVSSLANALEAGFAPYMEAFTPFLFNALNNQDEPGLCAMAIGLVSDLARALGEQCQPYCDQFMNYLLNNLRSTSFANQFKPAILQCFSDIAGAIGGHFETYLSVVGQVLQQAAGIESSGPDVSYELFDYVMSLREAIMDAWGGIVVAMRTSGKNDLLKPFVPIIFALLNKVWLDQNRTEGLLRSAMGVIGDLAESFPNGEFVQLYRADWLMAMIRETRSNREFQSRTIETARWAREQVKRQIGGTQGVQQMS